jgi:hypothetical protein
LNTEEEVVEFLTNDKGFDKTVGEAFWLFQMYCECRNGIDKGCATKIPNISENPLSEEGVEYCKFTGVWNGDFELDNFYDLPEEVQQCGCYFVQKTGSVTDTCPGVDLGAFAEV